MLRWTTSTSRLQVSVVPALAVRHSILTVCGLAPGDGKFLPLSLKFCYGDDSAALKEGRVAAIQTISGTGALSTVGRFLHRFRTGTPLYMSDPTWANHGNIFNEVNVETRSYRYYDPSTISLNFDGMRQDMEAMEDGAAILLHTCAHNPTGIDPTAEQWSELCEIAVKKDLICVFDNAYQGFASGDAEHDAASLRTVRRAVCHAAMAAADTHLFVAVRRQRSQRYLHPVVLEELWAVW